MKDSEYLHEKQLLLDEMDCGVFVIDGEYNLLYTNKNGILHSGGNGDYAGKKCYEYFNKRDKPCTHCKKEASLLGACNQEMHNAQRDEYYSIRTVSSVWNNLPVTIEYVNNITEARKAELRLKELEKAAILKNEQYRLLLENTRLCVFDYDCVADTLIFTINNSEKRIERKIENYMNSIYESQLIYPDDIPEYRKCFESAMERVLSAVHEFRGRVLSEDFTWNRAYYASVADDTGKVCRILGRVDDIQEEKNAQQHYQAELAYNTSIENQSIASIRVNLTENMVEKVSGNIEKLGIVADGSTLESVLQKHTDFLPDKAEKADFVKRFSRKALLKSFENGETLIVSDHRAIQRSGKAAWVRISVNMLRNPDSNNVMAIVLMHNIEKLKLDEAVMKKVIETEYDYIAYIDVATKNFVIYSENSHASDLPVSDGKDIDEAFHSMSERYVIPAEIADYREKNLLAHLVEMLDKQPEYIVYFQTVEFRHKKLAFRYLDREKTQIMLTRRDVTNTVETEEKMNQQLHAALKQARAANEAKNRFLANMSHDLRTPMNAILGLTELSLDLTDNDELLDNLTKIKMSGKYLLSILNDILDMNKIESRKLVLSPEPYAYMDFINNITNIIKPLCDEKNITLEMNPLEDGPTVLVDKTKFEQVFFNVFSNAVKYTPVGGHIEHYTEIIRTDDKITSFACHIIDNGCGMSEEFLQHAFEPFSREVQSGYSGVQGTGLGLSIAKSIIETMGGRIEVKSKLGKGTEVIIYSQFKLAAAVSPDEQKKMVFDETKLDGLRVLLVEDHPLNQTVAKKLLERKNMSVTVANNGKIGVDEFAASPIKYYDVILMDVRMPVMDGLTAAKAIRALDRADAKTIPIIAMTANAYAEDRKASLAAGMNAHLAKPIEPEQLYKAILSVLDREE